MESTLFQTSFFLDSIPPILFHMLKNKQFVYLTTEETACFPSKQFHDWFFFFPFSSSDWTILSSQRPHVQLAYSDLEDESLKLLHLMKKLVIHN